MRCGYEKPIDPDLALAVWDHPGSGLGPPAVCVGYTAKLPAVLEIDMLGVHWERQTLAMRCGGEVPEVVFDRLEVMLGQDNAASRWKPTKGQT